MQKSSSIKELAKALKDFQSKMGKLPKDTTNPFYKSKYCSLPTILSAIQSPLSECGLTFSQLPDGDNQITTILIHADSGEYLESSYAMHPIKSDPQSIGSAITYARRYALGAILGLNIDEDDDGNAASNPQEQKKDKAKEGLTEAELGLWKDAVNGCSSTEQLTKLYNSQKDVTKIPVVKALFTKRRTELEAVNA